MKTRVQLIIVATLVVVERETSRLIDPLMKPPAAYRGLIRLMTLKPDPVETPEEAGPTFREPNPFWLANSPRHR
jgi:hypothetical protein